jgi:hypothetical protein
VDPSSGGARAASPVAPQGGADFRQNRVISTD